MDEIRQILIQKEIDAHLKEYEALRTEIREYIQRIDKYIGIYLAALFAVVAVFLNPASQFDLTAYFQKLSKNPLHVGITLLIPILNSILQVHLLSFMHAILAMAKYTTHVLGDRVSEHVRNAVLKWDFFEKDAFVNARSIASIFYSVCVSLISFSVLILQSHLLLFKQGLLLFLVFFVAAISFSLSIFSQIEYIFVSSRFHLLANEGMPHPRLIFGATLTVTFGFLLIYALMS